MILVGNLGRDPEIQTFDSVKRASFSLATTEHSRDKDGNEVQHTEWHNIVVWRGLAAVSEQYLHKGSQVYLEGKIRTRSYDGKDGQKRYTTEIQVDNMVLLGSAHKEGVGDSPNLPQQNQMEHPANPIVPPYTEPPVQQTDFEDLPF